MGIILLYRSAPRWALLSGQCRARTCLTGQWRWWVWKSGAGVPRQHRKCCL